MHCIFIFLCVILPSTTRLTSANISVKFVEADDIPVVEGTKTL